MKLQYLLIPSKTKQPQLNVRNRRWLLYFSASWIEKTKLASQQANAANFTLKKHSGTLVSNIDAITTHTRVVYVFIHTTSSPAFELRMLLVKFTNIITNTQIRREPSLQQTASFQANS